MRRKDTRTDTLPSAPVGFLSGLESHSEISELLNELYGDGLTWHRKVHVTPEKANLGRLRDLPRAEAIRIAMIKYGWDAATAAKRVDIERDELGQDG